MTPAISSPSSSSTIASSSMSSPAAPTTPLSQRSVAAEKNGGGVAVQSLNTPNPPGGRRTMNPIAKGSPTPAKLRRKVSVEDPLQNVASIQRLVEYFVTISCHPRNEPTAGTSPRGGGGGGGGGGLSSSSPSKPPKSPKLKKPVMQRGVSAPIPSSMKDNSLESGSGDSRIRGMGIRVRSAFRNKAKTSTEHGLAATLSQESAPSEHKNNNHDDETREETLPPPKPRGTWKRDEQQEANNDDGNIRMPSEDKYDEYNFQPKITSRYPLSDHHDNPLNPMVTQFCHPVGDVVVPTRDYQMPRVHYFVLTNDKGRKLYGTCLTVYEEYEPPSDAPLQAQHLVHSDSGERDIEITVDNEESTLYLPRCLCILSMWPYMTAFREYLAQIYRLATSTNCMTVPLERYIMNICMEIPAPPPGAFEVQINILDSVIRFWSPPAKLPIAYVALPYQVLFDCLDVENILHLWYCLTMEQKVLLVSSQYSNLTVCSEILCSLLYPMKWSHLYVPLLPRFLCPMLDAPVPYLCGVTRDNWLYVQQFVSEETIVVDLDRNNVMFGEKTPKLPPLPGKKWKKLRNSLEETAGHLFWRTRGLESEYREFRGRRLDLRRFKEVARQKGEIRWNEKLETFDQAFNLQFTPDSENIQADVGLDTEQTQWDRVQESFLRFFVALLKDYRQFLVFPDGDLPPSPSPASGDWLQWNQRRSFDHDGFIASQKAEYVPYLSNFSLTQQFDDFITKRLYSPEMPDIIFFDQSIDAKLNRSRLKLRKVDTPFLQSVKAHKVLQKFTAVEPCALDLDVKTPFVYRNWPETFNTMFFGIPRPIPGIITAEFDRQAALISRLRSANPPGPPESMVDFYGSDYDTTPEGMAFTVFFYAYSAVIGREWQAFQHKQRELQAIGNAGAGTGNEELIGGVGDESDPGTQVESVEVHITRSDDALSNTYLELCNGCPNGVTTVDDALIYATTSPCPRQIDEFNMQAQIAYEAISELANSPFTYLKGPTTSLLDMDKEFAEYEEARDVAVAQLDLAFDTLKTMEMRGLLSDPDIFKSLMEACGRCGDTKRALELIEMMKRDGLAADQEVLSCFMAAFAHNDDDLGDDPSHEEIGLRRQRSSDPYSALLKKNFESMKRNTTKGTVLARAMSDSEVDSWPGDSESDTSSEILAAPLGVHQPLGSAILDWFYPRETNVMKKAKRRRRRQRRRTSMLAGAGQPLTDRLSKQMVLGESLLDFLYPDLKIECDGNSCLRCSNSMKRNDVIAGWEPRAFEEVTTSCPKCQHRFVPRFSVSCSSPVFEGSQGVGTPLYCEFLSPWVLRKELGHFISGERGVDLILDPEWRDGIQVGATIWWNLIGMFKYYNLPFSFLLQGSFQNRLISPVPQD